MNALPRTFFKLEIKTHRNEQQGTIFLCCAVPGQTNPVRRSTGWKMSADYWDAEESRVKRAHDDYELINDDLSGKMRRLNEGLKKLLSSNKPITKESIAAVLDGKNDADGNFIDFYQYHIDVLAARGAEKSYIDQFKSQLNVFKRWAGEYVSFSDVDWQYLERYEVHCRQQVIKGQPAALHTVCKKMKRLTEVVNRAVRMGKIEQKNVGAYIVPSRPKVKADHLNYDQLNLLTTRLIDEGYYDHDPILRMVCAYFLVESYSGIRQSDWNNFDIVKHVDVEGMRVKSTQKTDGDLYLPFSIFKGLKRVLDYIRANNIVFDLSQQKTNERLHDIGRDLRLKFKLTTHVGRHTCGTLLGELGYSISFIAQVLAISESTAKVYVKRTSQGLKNEMERVGREY